MTALSDAVLPLSLLVGAAVLAVKAGGAVFAALPPIDWDLVATPALALVLLFGLLHLSMSR